jgi:hypothetical protein
MTEENDEIVDFMLDQLERMNRLLGIKPNKGGRQNDRTT